MSALQSPAGTPRGRTRGRAGVYLGLGSNLGDRDAHLAAGLAGLAAADAVPVECSAVYRTAPVGGPAQDDYLNMAARVETSLEPAELLAAILQVEGSRGRARGGARWGPRTLDVDILLFGDRLIDAAGLTVPHPRLHLRRFVLVPLADLAPDAVHPVSGLTVADLLASCDDASPVTRHGDPPPAPVPGGLRGRPGFR